PGGGGGGGGGDGGGGSDAFGALAVDWASLPPNAFAVTLFCLEESLESRSADVLPHAFAAFPDRDYCVVTVPAVATAAAVGPLLRGFSPVPPRPGSTFSHVLYVLHRDCLAAWTALRVVPYSAREHRLGAAKLLECWDPDVVAALREAEDGMAADLTANPPTFALVATLGRQVVGVAIADRAACSVEAVTWLRANYHVEDAVAYDRHRPKQQARLAHLVLHPFFASCGPLVLREVMRLYDKTVLYWEGRVGPVGSDGSGANGGLSEAGGCSDGGGPRAVSFRAIPAVVSAAMVPVRPRRRMQPPPGREPPSWLRVDKSGAVAPPTPSTLFLVSRRQLTRPRAAITTRIVVVGASTCGAAVLESLAYHPDVRLTSLTLVSPAGLPTPPPASGDPVDTAAAAATATTSAAAAATAGGTSGTAATAAAAGTSAVAFVAADTDAADARRKCCLGLEAAVRVLPSRLVDLDRVNRAILLPEGTVLPYDILVLTTGLQDDTAAKCPVFCCRDEPGGCGGGGNVGWSEGWCDGLLAADTPDAPQRVTEVLERCSDDDTAVVYGVAPAALVAVQTLIAMGVAPARIVLIRPPPPASASGSTARYADSLGHAAVDRHASGVLRALGVTELNGLTLARAGADGAHRLAAAEFDRADGSGEPVAVDCRLLLCCCEPAADADVLRAVDCGGLVFDGRLVVGTNFSTVDPAILAGGTLTKFSRLHQATTLRHDHYSSRELGEMLGAAIMARAIGAAKDEENGRRGNDSVKDGGENGRNTAATSPPRFSLARGQS
ncbi:unnamed protein product, partial [Phaeothamnion confervicola]